MKKSLLAVGMAASLGTQQAMAAVPAEVTTAITDLSADAITIIGLAGVAAVGVMGVGIAWTMGLSIVPKFLKRGSRA